MAKSALEMQNDRLKGGAGMIKALPHMMAIDEKMSPSSLDSEMFGEMRKPLGQDGMPKHGIYALLDGLFAGAQMGSKQKMKAEQAEKYQMMKKMTDFIVSSWTGSEKDLQDLQNKEKGQEELSTFISPVVSASLDPNTSQKEYEFRSHETFNNMKKLYKELNGVELDNAVKGKDYWILKTPDGNLKPVSFKELIGDTRFGENLKQANETMNARAHMTSAEASETRAETEATYKPTEIHERTRRNDIAEINATTKIEALGMKSVKEVLPRLESSTIAVKLADDLIKDAKANPKMFGTYATAILNTKGDANALELWAQQNLVSEKERDTLMRMAKNVASLQLAEAKSLGGQNNMTLDSWMQQMFPNGQYSQSNFLYIMDQNKAKYEFYKDMYRDVLNQPANSYIGTAYDQRAGELNQKSENLRTELDGGKFSKLSTEELLARKNQIMGKK